MNKQIECVLDEYYGIPIDVSTTEFYQAYLEACKVDHVEPKSKQVVISKVCRKLNLSIKTKFVKQKYFKKRGE